MKTTRVHRAARRRGGRVAARGASAAAAMPVIGFLDSTSPGPYRGASAAFRQGLNETGYVEGAKCAIEYRWAEGQYDRLPSWRPIWFADSVG